MLFIKHTRPHHHTFHHYHFPHCTNKLLLYRSRCTTQLHLKCYYHSFGTISTTCQWGELLLPSPSSSSLAEQVTAAATPQLQLLSISLSSQHQRQYLLLFFSLSFSHTFQSATLFMFQFYFFVSLSLSFLLYFHVNTFYYSFILYFLSRSSMKHWVLKLTHTNVLSRAASARHVPVMRPSVAVKKKKKTKVSVSMFNVQSLFYSILSLTHSFSSLLILDSLYRSILRPSLFL